MKLPTYFVTCEYCILDVEVCLCNYISLAVAFFYSCSNSLWALVFVMTATVMHILVHGLLHCLG